jgi:predicted RNase H-like nuclease (RuvC/YqgF family)
VGKNKSRSQVIASLMDLDGYRTIENFLKKLNQLEEYYIDSKANEIPYQGGSLAQKLVAALEAYEREKSSSATGLPQSDYIIQHTVILINAARIHGLVKDKQDLMQKLKAIEDRLGECEDRSAQLKNQNEELQRKLRDSSQKRKDTSKQTTL